MRRRKRHNKLQPIGDVLFPILKKKGMASNLEEKALFKLWEKAVGPQIAGKTKPDAFRKGMLFVKTVSSVWVQQLHFVKEDIIEKLNDLNKKQIVKDIRFTVGHSITQEKEAGKITHAAKTVLKTRDREMIAECTETLADRELAAVLKRVMRLEISRRRQWEAGKAH